MLMMASSDLAPCANARRMRKKLARDTDRPKLLMGSSGSIMLSAFTVKVLPPYAGAGAALGGLCVTCLSPVLGCVAVLPGGWTAGAP